MSLMSHSLCSSNICGPSFAFGCARAHSRSRQMHFSFFIIIKNAKGKKAQKQKSSQSTKAHKQKGTQNKKTTKSTKTKNKKQKGVNASESQAELGAGDPAAAGSLTFSFNNPIVADAARECTPGPRGTTSAATSKTT